MHPRRCRAHQVLAPRQALVQLVEVQKVVEDTTKKLRIVEHLQELAQV